MSLHSQCPRLGRWSSALVIATATLVLGGCASGFSQIAPTPPEKFQRLGPATGEACGSMGFLGTATSFVPMGLNSRTERAYANAVASVPGATALVDVTMQEDWVWWILGSSRCVTVRGEAVK